MVRYTQILNTLRKTLFSILCRIQRNIDKSGPSSRGNENKKDLNSFLAKYTFCVKTNFT